MVTGRAIHQYLDAEPDHLVKLAATCPGIRDDPKLAFPVKLIDIVGQKPHTEQVLMVMPKAAGERFGDWMTMTCFQGRQAEVVAAVHELGRELKDFHRRYGNRKHADFSPSNIYYNAATRSFTFIDLGGVGTAVMNDDITHFIQAITIMGRAGGPGGPLAKLIQPATHAIRAGYSQGL
jgi:hypothetical protein